MIVQPSNLWPWSYVCNFLSFNSVVGVARRSHAFLQHRPHLLPLVTSSAFVDQKMVREGGFSMSLRVNRQTAREQRIAGGCVALATAGSAFEVVVSNDNRSTYVVRLFVDGKEAEPGYIKKLRGEDYTIFKGWMVGREIHEFLFAKSAIDQSSAGHAGGSSSSSAGDASSTTQIGEVRALIYATKRVRIESDESDSCDEDYHRSRRGVDALGVRALPKKVAIKELGVQSRAGGAIERVRSHGRRRRGEYRLEKIKPEVAELSLLYRNSFWFERNSSGSAGGPAATAPRRESATSPSNHSGGPAGSAASQPPSHEGKAKVDDRASNSDSKPPSCTSSSVPETNASGSAKPIAKRRPGETARGPDGKRRRKDGSAVEPEQEVIELSD